MSALLSCLRRPLLPLLAAVLLLAVPAASAAEREMTVDELSVVKLTVKTVPNARSARSLGTTREGTGVVIDSSGLVMTIGYLVTEADTVELSTTDGRRFPATVIGTDNVTGLGLVKSLQPLPVKPVDLGQSAAVKLRDVVLIVGFDGVAQVMSGAAYLSVGRGFKAGGFNIGAVVPVDRLLYRPEALRSVELGWKGRAANSALDWQLALFSMRRTDQQVSTSVQVDPGDPLSFIYLTDNAARGENVGAEAALQWRPDARWRVDASLGWLRARFMDYQRDSVNLAGRDQAHAPGWQYAIGAEHRFATGWFLRADVQGTDSFYFSESHDQVSAAYTLVHLRGGFERGPWRASVWVRNAFDEAYAQRGFFFGNEPPDFPDRLYVQQGDPRQLGLTISYQWP